MAAPNGMSGQGNLSPSSRWLARVNRLAAAAAQRRADTVHHELHGREVELTPPTAWNGEDHLISSQTGQMIDEITLEFSNMAIAGSFSAPENSAAILVNGYVHHNVQNNQNNETGAQTLSTSGQNQHHHASAAGHQYQHRAVSTTGYQQVADPNVLLPIDPSFNEAGQNDELTDEAMVDNMGTMDPHQYPSAIGEDFDALASGRDNTSGS